VFLSLAPQRENVYSDAKEEVQEEEEAPRVFLSLAPQRGEAAAIRQGDFETSPTAGAPPPLLATAFKQSTSVKNFFGMEDAAGASSAAISETHEPLPPPSRPPLSAALKRSSVNDFFDETIDVPGVSKLPGDGVVMSSASSEEKSTRSVRFSSAAAGSGGHMYSAPTQSATSARHDVGRLGVDAGQSGSANDRSACRFNQRAPLSLGVAIGEDVVLPPRHAISTQREQATPSGSPSARSGQRRQMTMGRGGSIKTAAGETSKDILGDEQIRSGRLRI